MLPVLKEETDLQPIERALQRYAWDKVSWTFKIIPDGADKECRIIAEWGSKGPFERYELICNTRDAQKMSTFEWLHFNQQKIISDIIKKFEVKFKDDNGFYVNGVWFPN